MKITPLKKINYQNKNDQISNTGSKIKTTDINILLNRVREENKNNNKKKVILSISIISFLSFISILAFGS